MVERDRRLSMLLSEDERARLGALAEDKGLSASDYIRQFIRDAYAARFGDKKPPKPKK